MTTPHPFAALLRKLDAEASKAPWAAVGNNYDDDGRRYDAICDADGVEVIGGPYSVLNESSNAFIVTLRNAAPDVAALVEAADALRLFFADNDGAPPNMDSRAARDRLEAFNAALDALRVVATQAKETPK